MPESTEEQSDGSLIRSVRDGSEVAAEDLYERYGEKINKLADQGLAQQLAGRIDPADITQSVFRTFFRRVADGQYDAPRGDSIWNLLATIALNKIRAVGVHHRAIKRDVRRTSHVQDITTLRHLLAGDEDSLRILQLTIEEILEQLTEPQRRIIQLRLEDHDIVSISQQTSLSKRSVERVLYGFRVRLRKAIEDVDE